MSPLRILIVDDESLVREAVRKGASEMDGITVIDECGSGKEAIAAIHSLKPDLVLLDIQMQDCSGIDVVEQVGLNHMPPVVFVTAYDEFAVKAFELNAVDYLLKPFDTSRLHASIERARRRLADGETLLSGLQVLVNQKQKRWPDRIVVRNGDRFDFVGVDTISWIESADNYTHLHCGVKCHLHSESLASLEQRLNPALFLRVHRGRIVHIAHVTGVRHRFNSTYEVELRDGTRLSTGRNYRTAVQAQLLH